jgi:predicted dehydrogenase
VESGGEIASGLERGFQEPRTKNQEPQTKNQEPEFLMPTNTNRRDFLKTSATIGAGYFVAGRATTANALAPSEKVNVAVVGVGGRGESNLNGVAPHANVVALCDVDSIRLGKAAERFPQAKLHGDWRKMLERPGIDAVVVSTPDHNHAIIAVAAMKQGKHLYCEKPLAHSLYEVRAMRETAREMKVITQMGNQLHATDRLRSAVEVIQSGVLGPVHEVACWSTKVFSGGKKPTDAVPVPPNLNWDIWLGPAPEQAYSPKYVPFYWRGWWDFGEGNYGDMACHIMDTSFWGLGLKSPTKVWAEGPPPDVESAPDALTVHYTFPSEGDRPGVELTWYDGKNAPPKAKYPLVKNWPEQGTLVVGEKGMMLFPHASGETQLLPEEKFADFKRPEPTLPRIANDDHHLEWLTAIQTGGRALSNFEYGGAMTETVLAGIVSYRIGQPLDWDGEKLVATNAAAAAALIEPQFRKGWEV